MPDEPAKRKEAAEKGKKRSRASSSQTDEEGVFDQHREQGDSVGFET